MRFLIRSIDRFLRRVHGVFEFCDDEMCILRLQVARAPHVLHLSGQTVDKGEPVLEVHLWNEHMPIIPPEGPTLSWATGLGRQWVHSLYSVGRYMRSDPRLSQVRAVGSVTAILSIGGHYGGVRIMERSGFTVTPHRVSLGRLGASLRNLYLGELMRAFNPVSMHYRQTVRLSEVEMWMLAEEFLGRYG